MSDKNMADTNETRAQRGQIALTACPGTDPNDIKASIVDLVADLLHLASQNDIEADYVLGVARTHFDAEMADREEAMNRGGE